MLSLRFLFSWLIESVVSLAKEFLAIGSILHRTCTFHSITPLKLTLNTKGSIWVSWYIEQHQSTGCFTSVHLENTTIKQADVVLLGFPLMWPMTDEIRRNDLLSYEPLTRDDGPAMTWSMHSIGFLELGDFDKAQQLFKRSYETYVRAPFNVSGLIYPYFFLTTFCLVFRDCRFGRKLKLVSEQWILSRGLEVSCKQSSSATVASDWH